MSGVAARTGMYGCWLDQGESSGKWPRRSPSQLYLEIATFSIRKVSEMCIKTKVKSSIYAILINLLYTCIHTYRYNISTDDYDPFNTNAIHNQDL